MNRNAARHLALVVSVLLCFFVYMGYRFWGFHEAPPEPESIAGADAGAGIVSGVSDGLALTSPGSGTLRPPERSDVSVPLSGGEVGLALTPPSSSAAPVAAPGGAVEETAARSAASGGSGSITGLIPAPPSDSGSALGGGINLGAGMLTPPGLGDADPAMSARPGLALAPPPGGVGPAAASEGTGRLTPPPLPSSGASGRPTQFPSNPVAAPRTGTAPAVTTRPGNGAGVQSALAQSQDQPPPMRQPVSPPGAQVQPPVPEPSESLRIYVIQPGDTLSRIATRELGSISLADNIYLLNRDVISDPDHLLVGVRIRLPVRERLGNGIGTARPGPGTLQQAPRGGVPDARVHRVQRGETLSNISLRYYGTSAGWNTIFEANRDILPNPNQLKVGMELIIPPYDG